MSENFNLGQVIVSLYPSEEDIDKLVEGFTKNLNVRGKTKKAIQFGYQEGLYKMLEVWNHCNNER